MRSPHAQDNDHVTVTLSKDDYRLFLTFLSTLRRVDGWCRVNKALGKWLLVGSITLLILFSQGLDALRNLFGMMGKR